MNQLVRKAVFPVAGLGTRILPATKAMPKEMLPVVDKPLIQYAVEEAKAAGIEQFYFVTGRGQERDRGPFRRRLRARGDAYASAARASFWLNCGLAPRRRPDRLHATAAPAGARPCGVVRARTWSATSPLPCFSSTI